MTTFTKRLPTPLRILIMLAACGAALGPARAGPPALDLPLSAFFKHPVGARGLELSDTVRRADGQLVRLVGYMVVREEATAGRFLITPRPVRLSEHADGEADDLPPATVTVLLDRSQADRIVEHRPGPVALSGRLQVGRAEEPGGRVSWFRLQLDPQALQAEPLHAAPTVERHKP